MSQIRYRRTSLRTALGIAKEEKRIKSDLGITALLKPFRWWSNGKHKLNRGVGYYSLEARLARHVLPHTATIWEENPWLKYARKTSHGVHREH